MSWSLYRNLQSSLQEFLQTSATTDNLASINGNSVNFIVGKKDDNNWTLPVITCYFNSETLTRFEVGSNKRDDRQLIIIDIFAENEADRLDFAKWVIDTINDGWRYYTYTSNPSNPNSPTKVAGGWVNVDFLTNTKVVLNQNIDVIDQYRHRISINVWITGSN